ncbi:MAG TPA: FtsH protease activity modulator HflK [Clostridiales bacterium]|nr:FtsH protease activity modulator HflK [Clostridiales bacterium]
MIRINQIFKLLNYTRILSTLIIIIIAFIIFSSIYTVKDGEVGILRTFGKVTEYTKPGLHLKFPYPIQEIDVINITRTYIIELGQLEKENINNTKNNTKNHESQSITKDNGIVLTNLIVEWKIIDPYAFLFNAKNTEYILRNIINSCLKSVIGKNTIDFILTDGKMHIANSVKEKIQKELDNYNFGIEIIDVKLLDARPPEEIKDAFEAVADAIVKKDELINKAEEYRMKKILAVEGEANKIIKEAEAYSEERINKAKSETETFNSLYKEYRMNKEVTKTRMLIETLEEILPSANIYILDTKENTLNYLPIQN